MRIVWRIENLINVKEGQDFRIGPVVGLCTKNDGKLVVMEPNRYKELEKTFIDKCVLDGMCYIQE